MKIIVDAMGGDNAPAALVRGALEAHKIHGVDILLVGRTADILRVVEDCGEKTLPAGVEIKDAPEVVEISEMEVIADDELTEDEIAYEKAISLPYVALINGVRCMRLYPGESLSTIAREYNISRYELLEYNEAPNDELFHEGDIVYLAKKKNKFNDAQDTYIVQEGDTWRSISQLFGVKFSYLLEKNNKSLSDQPVAGERIRLR